MNKDRRKDINAAVESLTEISMDIERLGEEEEEYFDNMPEGIQMSEKGERAEEVVSDIGDITSELEDIIDRLREVAA